MERRLFLKGLGAVALLAPVGIPTLEAVEAPVMAVPIPRVIGPSYRATVISVSFDAEQGRATLSFMGQWGQYVVSMSPEKCMMLQPGEILEIYDGGSTAEAD